MEENKKILMQAITSILMDARKKKSIILVCRFFFIVVVNIILSPKVIYILKWNLILKVEVQHHNFITYLIQQAKKKYVEIKIYFVIN